MPQRGAQTTNCWAGVNFFDEVVWVGEIQIHLNLHHPRRGGTNLGVIVPLTLAEEGKGARICVNVCVCVCFFALLQCLVRAGGVNMWVGLELSDWALVRQTFIV